jgi:hypothetical protein
MKTQSPYRTHEVLEAAEARGDELPQRAALWISLITILDEIASTAVRNDVRAVKKTFIAGQLVIARLMTDYEGDHAPKMLEALDTVLASLEKDMRDIKEGNLPRPRGPF